MTKRMDPRRAKDNTELGIIEKAMRDSWRRFRNADNHSEKRGNAMILQAHLEEWIDQPEKNRDLEEGVSSQTELHFTSKEAVRRHIRTSTTDKWCQKGDYDVLADPLGCPDYKKTIVVGRYKNREVAVAKADKLAGDFGIRFAVARVVGNVDNH